MSLYIFDALSYGDPANLCIVCTSLKSTAPAFFVADNMSLSFIRCYGETGEFASYSQLSRVSRRL